LKVGLYLCIFDGDDELDGVEVGAYSDFGTFRDKVTEIVEQGMLGSRCPILILHSDCDGEWSPAEASGLIRELDAIEEAFAKSSPIALHPEWRAGVATSRGRAPANLLECFFDVSGELLTQRLKALAETSVKTGKPISFQ
jgi:hypothetical protein